MKYRSLIRPEAVNDLEVAFLWYEEKRIGLGHDFLLQVDAGIRFIERNPEISLKEYKGTRRYFIKRFPYKIIYLIEKESIIVLGVIHGKRNPNLTKERLNNI